MIHVILFYPTAFRPSVVEDDLRRLFASSGATVKAFKFFQYVSILLLSCLIMFSLVFKFLCSENMTQCKIKKELCCRVEDVL